jgi:hypothetical protein
VAGVEPAAVAPFAVLGRLGDSGVDGAAGPEDRLGGYQLVLWELLGDLGRGCAVRYAALWLPAGPDYLLWTPSVVWRPEPGAPGMVLPEPVGDPDVLLTVAGVVATTDVTDGGVRCGVLVLAHPERAGLLPVPARPLGTTALCVGLLLRRARYREEALAAQARADRAVRRVGVARLELATVQAVERDRLAVAVTATPDRQLRTILARADALKQALHTGSPDAATIVATMRSELSGMIEQFRALVRGVYPQVLRGVGVHAALKEFAGVLGVPVDFHGELGRRESWEIESGLYQAAASAVAALGLGGGAEPVRVELSRVGAALAIRAGRAGVEPARVAAALRDDARRLAALGGRLYAEWAPGMAETVVDIRLPVRLDGDWPLPAHPVGRRPARPASRSRAGAGAIGAAVGTCGAGAAERRLVDLLLACRGVAADSVPLRVALDRQDGLVRVAVVGTQAERLVAALCDWREDAAWQPPHEEPALPASYQYGPYRRVTLEPGHGAPTWRPVHTSDWSGVKGMDWSDMESGPGRLMVESPAGGLRGLRLVAWRERVDADLAVRLRGWSGGVDGPPDAVVLVLSGPATAAESEFVNVLRTPGEVGFPTVVFGALRVGAVAPPRSRQWLQTTSDAMVEWYPGAGGGGAIEGTIRAELCASAGILAARWALRALRAGAAAGQLDGAVAQTVEAAAADAYQIAELDLTQALRGRRILLPRGHEEALRLLGGYGKDARARLGLADDAGPNDEVRAATQALAYWRERAVADGTGPEERGACASVIRACERLLADVSR